MTLKQHNLNYFMIPYLFYFVHETTWDLRDLSFAMNFNQVKTDILKNTSSSLSLPGYRVGTWSNNNNNYNENIQNPHLQ